MISILAGTGHRPDKLGGYTKPVYEKIFILALEALGEHNPSLVITGMALGWDQALAEAAYVAGIPFHAYIPFEGQESRWPAQSQKFYRNLMACSARKVVIAEGGFSVRAMHARNEAMVDASTGVLALWNGDESGGTAGCIKYARKVGKPITNLWEKFCA